jgi:NADH-dependent peroxiredoxin subunit F
MVRDPVCRMELDETTASNLLSYGGQTYVFCSEGCQRLFEQSPAQYAKATVAAPGSAFELLIIGGGPAGLTAAVYASIQKIHTLMITENIGGQAIDSSQIKNYMGFDFVTGRELSDKFRDQLIHEHFVEHKLGTVTAVEARHPGYDVFTQDAQRFRAQALIIATGMQRRQLNVPGEERLLRRGVSYSVVQETARFQGTDVAIVGGGNSGLQAALELSQVARHLYLIVHGELTGDRDDIARVQSLNNLTLLTHAAVREIRGDEKVEGLVVQSAESGAIEEVPVAGVFIAIGFTPNSALVASLVKRNARGEIVIGPDGSTSAPGIFAAGDVTTAYGKRVIIASGEGAKAALAAYQYVLNH